MIVKDAIKILQKCDPKATLVMIQEEELECMPEWWDSEKNAVSSEVVEVISEDVHSHQMYLLAVDEEIR